jgi:hypothetical protein
MSRPSHPPWYNHPKNIRWRMQSMKFIITQFSLRSIFLNNTLFSEYTCQDMRRLNNTHFLYGSLIDAESY